MPAFSRYSSASSAYKNLKEPDANGLLKDNDPETNDFLENNQITELCELLNSGINAAEENSIIEILSKLKKIWNYSPDDTAELFDKMLQANLLNSLMYILHNSQSVSVLASAINFLHDLVYIGPKSCLPIIIEMEFPYVCYQLIEQATNEDLIAAILNFTQKCYYFCEDEVREQVIHLYSIENMYEYLSKGLNNQWIVNVVAFYVSALTERIPTDPDEDISQQIEAAFQILLILINVRIKLKKQKKGSSHYLSTHLKFVSKSLYNLASFQCLNSTILFEYGFSEHILKELRAGECFSIENCIKTLIELMKQFESEAAMDLRLFDDFYGVIDGTMDSNDKANQYCLEYFFWIIRLMPLHSLPILISERFQRSFTEYTKEKYSYYANIEATKCLAMMILNCTEDDIVKEKLMSNDIIKAFCTLIQAIDEDEDISVIIFESVQKILDISTRIDCYTEKSNEFLENDIVTVLIKIIDENPNPKISDMAQQVLNLLPGFIEGTQ